MADTADTTTTTAVAPGSLNPAGVPFEDPDAREIADRTTGLPTEYTALDAQELLAPSIPSPPP